LTVSGNTATDYGCGIDNLDAHLRTENSTVTKNTAPPGHGSGVVSPNLSSFAVEVLSSIISANTNNDDVIYFEGTAGNLFTSDGYNLIGESNATTAFDQLGD
jgi:hypothetical protein